MGFDCGFDVFPALEPTRLNKEKFGFFLQDVLTTYKLGDEVKKEEAYIVFPVGEHPKIPYHCQYFMRFSSKVSGGRTAAAEPYIRGVYKIAKKWLGDCVHFWHELNETDDHRQWGFYDWKQVYEAERKMKEERVEDEQEGKKTEGEEGENKEKEEYDREKEEGAVERVNDETTVNDRCYAVCPLPGKGQGVIATAKIPKGTRILAERPIFKVPRNTQDREALTKMIANELKSLDKEIQRAFFSLHNAVSTQSQSPLLGIARTNALPLGSGAPEGGIFLEASRINHSCCHNSQNTWNANLNQLTIHVIKDVEKGEEITISYVDGFKTYRERHSILKKSFDFECTCNLCSLPPEKRRQSDRRLSEISRLDDLIGDGIRIVNTPLACLRDAHTLLRLLEEEHVDNAAVARFYYDAFQIVIANGDQARAKVFAERAYAIRAVLEGEDSPETIKLKELAKCPGNHRLYGTNMRWRQSIKKVPQVLNAQEFESWVWRE